MVDAEEEGWPLIGTPAGLAFVGREGQQLQAVALRALQLEGFNAGGAGIPGRQPLGALEIGSRAPAASSARTPALACSRWRTTMQMC